MQTHSKSSIKIEVLHFGNNLTNFDKNYQTSGKLVSRLTHAFFSIGLHEPIKFINR